MQETNAFCIQLSQDDVIHTESGLRAFNLSKTFKIEELFRFLGKQWLKTEAADLFNEGLVCEVLQPGQNTWKQGKVKLQLSFIIDQPFSEETPQEKIEAFNDDINHSPSLDEFRT